MPKTNPDPILDAIQRYVAIWTEEAALSDVEDAISLAWSNPSQAATGLPEEALQAPAELLANELDHPEERLSGTKPTVVR